MKALHIILSHLFSKINIKHTKTNIISILVNYNSPIDAIVILLKVYRVSSLLVKISISELSEIPYPALIQYKNGNFAVLEKLEGDTLSLFDGEKGNHSLSLSEFEKLWSGVTLLIEKNEKSAEPNYKENRKQEIIENLRLPLLLLVLGFVVGYQALQFTALLSFAWLGTKLAGTVLAVLLLVQSLNKNSAVAKLCSFNKKTDCNSLLSSSAATLFGVISLAEIGFFYFASGLLLVLVSPPPPEGGVFTQNTTFALLSLFAVLSLPFVLWSIWYQWKIAKVWCPLCLGVAGVLVVETLISLTTSPLTPEGGTDFIVSNSPFGGWGALELGSFLVASLYFFLKPFFLSFTQVPVLQKEVAVFKQNIDIFTNLLQSQKNINLDTVPLDTVLGDVNAPVSLVFVTNPSCKPCQLAKPKVDALLAQFEEELKVIMIDTKTHTTWCNENHITHTPTFFVQGKQLPDLYRVEDLAYFVGEMAEEVAV